MKELTFLWKKITHTKALEKSSGERETLYFESVYRVAYLAGLSAYDQDLFYLLYSSIVKVLIILLICSELWYVFSVPWEVDKLIDSVNVITIQFSSLFKYRNMLVYGDIFKKLASSMESQNFDLSTSERKKLLDLWHKRNEAYHLLLLALGTCALLAWHIYPLMDDIEYNLMVPIRLPFEFRPTWYAPTYIVVMIVFSYVSYFVMVNDLILEAHLMHSLCQFAVLNDCFKNIMIDCSYGTGFKRSHFTITTRFTEKYLKRLGVLVQQHQFILNNALELREIISAPMLAQLAVSTTLICSIGYQVAMTASVNITKCLMSLLYLGYNMFVLYIICRWCEEMKIQSDKIGEAVYFSGWECGITSVPGVRTRILLIMARANKPLILSAGDMYDLSLASYANLVKTSYSALTVLLRLRH